MLYTEFLEGTKAREDSKTFNQYETIEKIYNECEDMTKEDAYKLWRQTYGKQQKIDRARYIKEITEMSEYRDPIEGPLTPEQHKTRRVLLQAVISVAETNNFQAGFTGALITPDNVTYQLETYRVVNGHRLSRLIIRYEGKTYGTAAIYTCGDARIHATPENLPEVA